MSCPSFIKIGSYLLELSCVQISSLKRQQQRQHQRQRHGTTRKFFSNFQKNFGFLHELELFKNFWFFLGRNQYLPVLSYSMKRKSEMDRIWPFLGVTLLDQYIWTALKYAPFFFISHKAHVLITNNVDKIFIYR